MKSAFSILLLVNSLEEREENDEYHTNESTDESA